MTFNEIKEILEEKGVKYEIRPKEGYGLVEFWTDTAGQDIPTEFDFDGTPDGFVKEFVERAENYDVDEEVELFVGMRGKQGVPDTIRELIDDCQEAKNTLLDIAKALKDGNTKSMDASLRGVGISEITGSVSKTQTEEIQTVEMEMARNLWKEFGDVPIDDNDCITCRWRSFEKGTNRFDIWKWFEDFFELSVAEDLMEVS